MRKIKLLYRADGGHPVGMGHIMRGLRLLDSLSQHMHLEVLFVSRRNQSVARVLSKAGLTRPQIHWLNPVEGQIIPVLGVSEFIDTANGFAPDVIIVDALDTPEEEMRILAEMGCRLVTQDDRGPGRICADLIINFLVRDPDPSQLTPRTRLLEGPQYAPLDLSYVDTASKRRYIESEQAKKVAVSLGGADATGLVIKVAGALTQIGIFEKVKLSVGPAFQRLDELKEIAAMAPWQAEVMVSVPSLLPVFLDADIAVVAGGITMHETACCGVPAIAVCQPIDHQILVADNLQEAGAMINLGYGKDLTCPQIAAAVEELASNQPLRQKMADAGPVVVDGHGIERVAKAVAEVSVGAKHLQ